ncbi:hypothetical protein ASPCAL06705 [Aspergillus calidoustus]|uniref:Uncharacterized protein n=1 Tax=Aspergillus calidoustus TaxID=454130 RepID=A0A0U5G1V8_ASPCI|nr:hypothetical protein ASPCAL06705 [Aspergillus calidoustus]
MAKGFEKVNACSVGNFEENTIRIPKWIANNGGQYSKQVTEETTHLIVTEEAFSKNVAAVSKAKELGTVWIVSYDWLSDSLLMNKRRPLPAKNYLLEDSRAEEPKVQKKGRQSKAQENKVTKNRVFKRKATENKAAKGKAKPNKALEEETVRIQSEKEKADQERAEQEKIEQEKVELEQEKVEKDKAERDKAQRGQGREHQPVENYSTRDGPQGTAAAVERPKPIQKKRKRGPKKSRDPFDTKRRTPKAQSVGENYKVFKEEDITYDVKLVRPSKSARGTREILRLKIYKSTAAPTTYATHISLSCLGPSKTDLLAPLGSSLETALAAFKGFFKEQTGTEWEDRMKGVSPPPKKDEEGNTLPPYRGWFWWDSGTESLASMFRAGKL